MPNAPEMTAASFAWWTSLSPALAPRVCSLPEPPTSPLAELRVCAVCRLAEQSHGMPEWTTHDLEAAHDESHASSTSASDLN